MSADDLQADEPLWQLRGVGLGGRDRPRLDGVDLDIAPGVTAVIGYSGAGKTSLLNLLVGFEEPTVGTVTCGVAAPADGLPIYWAPQNDGLWPHLTVRAHLESVAPAAEDAAAVTARLTAFDLASAAAAYPEQLSLGECSRLAIARALAAQPAVLVMDEPLVHVDPGRAGRYWDIVRGYLRRRQASLVFATHSPWAVLGEAEHAICIGDGRALYTGSVDALYNAPPTEELATYLGAGTWLTAAEMAAWLAIEVAEPQCLRPERLVVEPVATGPVRVDARRQRGPYCEVSLRDTSFGATKVFCCQATAKLPQPGEAAILRVVAAEAPAASIVEGG